MPSQRAIQPQASSHSIEIGIRWLPGPNGGKLEFDKTNEAWCQCDETGNMEIRFERVGVVKNVVLTPKTPGLKLVETGLTTPPSGQSGEGFDYSLEGGRILVTDRYVDRKSLGKFHYRIGFQAPDSSQSSSRTTRKVHRWDPEIVNRGDLGSFTPRQKNRPRY